MKLTKLSLIAALAVTTAMAGDAKISGDAKLFYSTDDSGTNDFFSKGGAIGDAAVGLDYTRDVLDGVTLNLGVTGISTLGLENNLVSGTWVNHGHDTALGQVGNSLAGTGGVKDQIWIDTANIVVKPIDKTMLVVGRQALDTPLAFTETWNVAPNTFDAAVMVDNHLEKTTLVAAYVGRGNGNDGFADSNTSGGFGSGDFSAYGAGSTATGTAGLNKGAYAVAAVTKLIPMTTAQVWWYNVRNEADAVWVQADVAPVKDVTVGGQFSRIMPKGAAAAFADTKAYAGKVGYSVAGFDLAGAFSRVENTGGVYMGNTATGGPRGGQSKLYTEAWWNYNFVGQPGAKTSMISANYGDFGAQYTHVDNTKNPSSSAQDLDEVTLTANKKVGPVDATVAYINTKINHVRTDALQAYLTVPFSLN